SLTRNAGATVKFVGVNSDIGTAQNEVIFTGSIAGLTQGLIPYASLYGSTGLELAIYGAFGVMVPTYVTTLAAAGPADIVRLTASENLTANKTINALVISGDKIDIGGAFNLAINAGAVLMTGGNPELARFLSGTTLDLARSE